MADTNVHRVVGNLLVGSSHFYVDTSTNKVGITTTNPQAGLHVNSNAYVETDLKIGSSVVINDTTVSTTTFAVTVVSGKFHIDTVETPVLSLQRGNTYVFDLSDGSNLTHPLAFSTASGSGSYTTGVTDNYDTILPGNSGSQVTFVVPESAPSTFYYYCETHGWGMGSSTASTISDRGGRVTASYFHGDGSNLTNVAGDSGSWVNGTNSNVHLATSTDKVGIGTHSPGAELHVAGTGAIIVPVGTTGERPGTAVNGMIRYNNTIGNIEVYTAGVWSPLTQPPTITGISPLTTLTSGGQVAAIGHQQDLLLLSDVSGYPVAADWRFGNAVDISSDGTYAVVGMWNAWSGNSRGQAFVYKRTGTTWVWQAVLYDDSSSDPAANGDNFGKCVSISSDGRYVLVGAEYDTINGTYGAGSAHVWYRQSDTGNGSWQYQQEITHPIPSQMGYYGIFGSSLDISGDGVWAVIAARQDPIGGVQIGKAYIYKRTNTTWSYVAQIAPANNNNGENNWGKNVQLSSDGLYALATCSKTDVGGSDTGSVFIFKRGASDSTWTLQQTLYHPTPQADSDFGGWYSESGQAAAFSSDATYVAIGSPNRDIGSVTNAGIVSIFKRTDATWAWEADLTHPTPNAADPGPNANFGDSLDISADGTMVVVGVPGRSEGGSGYTGAGSAQVYKRTGTTWAHFSELLNNGAGV